MLQRARMVRAVFDDDTVGGVPSTSPLGDPVGDMIWVASTESDDVADTAMVISDGISDKSLQYSNIGVPSLLTEVRFTSKETDLNRDMYWAAWNGDMENFVESTSPFDVSFGSFEIGMGWLRIQNGEYLARARDESWEFDSLGPASQTGIHTIIFRLDRDEATYSVWVLQPGAQNVSIDSRPLMSAGTFEESRLKINMRFSGEGHSSARYIMDNVSITERKPDEME